MTHPIVAYLISLAVGYWVLTLADKQNGLTKTLGHVFAWIIIVVSLLGPVCLAATAWCRHSEGGRWGHSDRCSWSGGGWNRGGMNGNCMMNGECPMDGKGQMKDECPMMGKGHGMDEGQMAPGGKGMMDKDSGKKDEKKDSD